jgi:phosphonopyruvate decarboxylase
MIDSNNFLSYLISKEYTSFYGVPDSVLASLSKSLYFDFKEVDHVITANEGSALAMSVGYQLSTNKTPVVYLQNSGLGNLINPYISLTNNYVYDIPALFIIGWRGEPSTKDEPQHIFQGKITPKLLELLEIEYVILDAKSNFKEIIEIAYSRNKQNKSFVILVKKDTFQIDNRTFPYKNTGLSRYDALEALINIEKNNNLYVSSTGKLSRELDEIRQNSNTISSDFYMIGGMGHTFSVAYSLANENPRKTILCLDGDGSFLMHLGSIGFTASKPLDNYIHILLNNSSHQSVGGQPNYINELNIEQLVESLGFKSFFNIEKKFSITEDLYDLEKPSFINIYINNNEKNNLERPIYTPKENKKNFIKNIKK